MYVTDTFCNTSKIYDKSSRASSSLVAYTVRLVNDRYKVYSGTSHSSSDLVYTVRRFGGRYDVYKGDSSASSDIEYAIHSWGENYKVYRGAPLTSKVAFVLRKHEDG